MEQMSNKTPGDDFAELDKILDEGTSGPSPLEAMEKKSDERERGRFSWLSRLTKSKALFIALLISSIFTGVLGIFIGLSPELRYNAGGSSFIFFHDDFVHLLLAALYCVSFVYLNEPQFAIAKFKYQDREEDNSTQKITMIAAMGLALLGIVGTGIAGGLVIASFVSFLDFQTVPRWAQVFIIAFLPIVIAIYALLYSLYENSSRFERAARILRDQRREMENNRLIRNQKVDNYVTGEVQRAEIRYILAAVNSGALSGQRALDAIRSGKSLADLEIEDGRDYDGGGIGITGRGRNQVITVPGVLDQAESMGYFNWTVPTYLAWLKMGPAEAAQVLKAIGRSPAQAYTPAKEAGYVPGNMTPDNFGALWHQLMVIEIDSASPQDPSAGSRR